MRPNILIFGFGYTAKFLAKKLAANNFAIIGTTRNPEKQQQDQLQDYQLIGFDRPAVTQSLRTATHILVSTPPDRLRGDPVIADFGDLLAQYAPQCQWLGYLSSTGVYGDHQGAWVDESSPAINLGQQANTRQQAEHAWQALAQRHQLPLHIFRIAGIYGPGRNALTRIAHGKRQTIFKPDHFFSRIHVADIASILLASLQQPNPMAIYNVADDEPAPGHEVDTFACDLLQLPPLEQVPFAQAELSPMASEFYQHNRRVNNHKIKQALGVILTYPTYRQGLQHLFAAGDY